MQEIKIIISAYKMLSNYSVFEKNTGLSNSASLFGNPFDMNLIPNRFLLQGDKFPYVCQVPI